jgi:hypothetical protein
VNQWEPQIRTNLDDTVYSRQLDELLGNVPGSVQAALVNVRFQEACVRMPNGQAAAQTDVESTMALTTRLFGDPDALPPADLAQALAEIGTIDSAHVCFREETLLVGRVSGNRALLLTASASLNQGSCEILLRSHCDQLSNGTRSSLTQMLDPHSDVLAGAIIDLKSGAILEHGERFQGASVLNIDAQLARMMLALLSDQANQAALQLSYRDGGPIEIRRVELVTHIRTLHWARIQFDPEHVMVLYVDPSASRGLSWVMLRRTEVEVVRLWVDGLLRYGVKSTMSPFPATNSEFLAIVDELRALNENDLLGRLDIGGFANYTVGSGEGAQRCQECIYYLPNGKWCDLPELPIPVEPHWWCRLWKI